MYKVTHPNEKWKPAFDDPTDDDVSATDQSYMESIELKIDNQLNSHGSARANPAYAHDPHDQRF